MNETGQAFNFKAVVDHCLGNFIILIMLRVVKRLSPALTRTPTFSIGFFRSLLHLMRTALNRVRWEENQQFTALEKRSSTVPKSAQEQTQLFVRTEQQISLSEEGRLQRLDQILGTKTYFHQGKVYHQRIDSDHLMEIQQLKRENPEVRRKDLDWANPQSSLKIKYKNKKNYYNLVSQLATYPRHQPGTHDLANQTDEHTIAFLAAETAFSTISLKPVELTAASLEQQSLVLAPEAPFRSRNYSYFRPQFSMQLLRVPQTLYSCELLQDPSAIEALGPQVEEVLSLDEIYEAIKHYDADERVHQYLRKVENNRVEYLFTDIAFDSSENTVAITIDLLDDGTEHCLLVKSLLSKEATLKPIFNMKPPVAFSADGKTIFYIQRSGEGGWIELVRRPVEGCWRGTEVIIAEEDEGIVFRGAPDKELALGKDSNSQFVFLTIKDYGKKYSDTLFVISSREDSLHLIPVDQDGDCQYFYDMSPQGLIYAKKKKVESGSLKYGHNESYIEELYHVPFKQHIQLKAQKLGLSQLPGATQDLETLGPEELDFGNKRCIFVADEHQFIIQVQVRKSHIVMVLNYASVYDKAILYFLPFKANAHPHSLILKGGSSLRLVEGTYSYDSQEVEFVQPQGMIQLERVYNIWKKELRQNEREAAKYHHEVMVVEEGEQPFQLHFLCKQLYLEQENMPVVLVMAGEGEGLDQQVLRQFLEKGVGVVQFCGRGTLSKDLQHFLGGSRQNFGNMLDDLKTGIEFIGNRMTTNISLYCKGGTNCLVGLWFNIYFPYLFNASVLHNGLYDLGDQAETSRLADFLGNLADPQAKACFPARQFNFFQHKFKTLSSEGEKEEVRIGFLENMVISSDGQHRLHSRKLIKRLRENQLLHYDTVFLKEYDDGYSTDLHNLSFLFSRIRDRLERELDEVPEDESESEDA